MGRYVFLLIAGILFLGLVCRVQLPSEEKTAIVSPNVLPKASLKIKGVNLVGTKQALSAENLKPLIKLGSNWISLMPYAFSKKDSTFVRFDHPRQWSGERSQGIIECIELAQAKNLKVMIKPHLWISRGGFTGEYGFESELDWQKWEQAFERYILHYARLADSLKVDMFCIATEMKRSVAERPQFWFSLIKKIRKIYSGSICYAANWDNFQKIPFWAELDFIGIDAYFPLSPARNPSVKELKSAWKPHLSAIEALQKKIGIPLVFTEFGYRSIDFGTRRPWESRSQEALNLGLQSRALEAQLTIFSKKKWFHGGFIWKWFPQHQVSGGKDHRGFSPQNKPAEDLIRRFYQIEE